MRDMIRHAPGTQGRGAAVALTAGLLCCLTQVRVMGEPRVLMIVREGDSEQQLFLIDEVIPMVSMLKKAGYTVDVSVPSGKPIGSGALRLNCDVNLSDVKVESYAAILVPCMGVGGLAVPDALSNLVKDADARGMIIAAQHSTEVLLCAGMFGRKWATAPGVVRDGNLITSFNCPRMARTYSAPLDTEGIIRALIAVIEVR